MMRHVLGVLLLFVCSSLALSEAPIPELIEAAGRGDHEKVKALLAAGSPVTVLSEHGETPLHVAAIRGDPQTVQALLDAGANVAARTPPGVTRSMTPLHWASYGGHVAMVRLLLGHGADPREVDEHEMSALQMAEEAGHKAVLVMLQDAAAAMDMEL